MDNTLEKHLRWHPASVSVGDRRASLGRRSCILWFTGLPASGKSTIANALGGKLHSMRVQSYVLDGDNIRHGLNNDLGFTPEDRKENIRRIGEVARLFVDAGLIIMVAFISPNREARLQARSLVPKGDFIEIYLKCDPEICEQRDSKGMYKKAKAGLIAEFTGVSAPYDPPENPEIIFDTALLSVETCVEQLLDYLIKNEYIKSLQSN
jgi:adenylylsulfate kinase